MHLYICVEINLYVHLTKQVKQGWFSLVHKHAHYHGKMI